MQHEFGFHVEMETEQLMRSRGLPYEEARRQALAAFGGIETHKESLRDGRGLAWLRGWWLNLKLGARMLARYPGVSIVGIAAMAIGIGLGAAYLEGVSDFIHPTLPLEDGHRIVGLQNWDVKENDPEPRSARDFVAWRHQLKSVEHLSAYRDVRRNIGSGHGAPEPASGAQITASGFQVARVPALLGRTVTDADEEPGSAPVIVLGFSLWRDRFSSDPGVVGRTIQVGNLGTSVVGVMPEGFAFPVSHSFWLPLRRTALTYESRQGPPLWIFGRLAPGVSMGEAQAELSAVGLRASREFPATHEHLRPRVMPYTALFIGDVVNWQAHLVQLFFVLLLLVLGSNVATMVFARTATRQHEIAMRFALGASRGQILAQFFVEALVLALVAATVGLAAVAWGARSFARFFWDVTQGQTPFWLDDHLNVTTVLYALVLAVLVSLVAGVLPAVKATGSRARARLRHAPGSADSALRFGGLWSTMIVVQVAFAVLILPPAIVSVSALGEADHTDPGFAAEEYLAARIEMDVEPGASDAVAEPDRFHEFQARYEELRRRLLLNPEISRVTFASRLPGMAHPEAWVDVESAGSAPGATSELVTTSSVATDYFAAFGAEIISGRAFNAADLRSAVPVVVVNEDFAHEVLQGRNAVGRRIRYSSAPSTTWFEVVGVVRNIGMDTTKDAFTSGRGPGVYHPLTRNVMSSAVSYSVRMAFHVRGDAAAFAPRLRELAQAVDPALRLDDVVTLDGPADRVSRAQRRIGRVFSWITALVALIALLISIAGTYSVMSFTVLRQTREIGIRMALGADPRQIIAGVFSRAMMLVVTGIVIGAGLWFYVIVYVLGGGQRVGLLMTTAGLLIIVGSLACGVPVRRALRIQPIEALRNIG